MAFIVSISISHRNLTQTHGILTVARRFFDALIGYKPKQVRAGLWIPPERAMEFWLISAMVTLRGESLTHRIQSMSFHSFFQHKKQLAELWEQKWSSMNEHKTSRAEIHRKVISMVTPMSDLDAKLMLREMGQRV